MYEIAETICSSDKVTEKRRLAASAVKIGAGTRDKTFANRSLSSNSRQTFENRGETHDEAFADRGETHRDPVFANKRETPREDPAFASKREKDSSNASSISVVDKGIARSPRDREDLWTINKGIARSTPDGDIDNKDQCKYYSSGQLSSCEPPVRNLMLELQSVNQDQLHGNAASGSGTHARRNHPAQQRPRQTEYRQSEDYDNTDSFQRYVNQFGPEKGSRRFVGFSFAQLPPPPDSDEEDEVLALYRKEYVYGEGNDFPGIHQGYVEGYGPPRGEN